MAEKSAKREPSTADRRVGIKLTEEQKLKAPEVIHPLVRTHPIANERGLYFSMNHTARIDGMSEQESLPMLDELRAHARLMRRVGINFPEDLRVPF